MQRRGPWIPGRLAWLQARQHWIELSFTPVAIVLGKLALPLLLVRVVVLRRELEALPLAVLVMATLQYVIFKEGADVHVFWPHYFALYFAFAMGAVAASLETLARRLAEWRRSQAGERAAPWVALGLALAPLLVILPDSVAALGYARRTGLRFDDGWRLIHQDLDKTLLLRHVAARCEAGEHLSVHQSVKYSWSLEWALGRPIRVVHTTHGPGRYLLLDSRFTDARALRRVARDFGVQAYGPHWVVDREASGPSLTGFAFARQEPDLIDWYLVHGNDPVLRIVPDAYHTWELRQHFDQQPNPVPSQSPVTPEQRRIAHNLAVAQGDRDRARELSEQLTAGLRRELAATYRDGTELLGAALEPGLLPLLRVYLRAGGPPAPAVALRIRGQVRSKPWSTVPLPGRKRDVGMPFSLPPAVWKPEFIYSSVSELRKQPGVVDYYASVRRGRSMTPEARVLTLH